MNLTKEKEKIKKEIDLIDDPKIIKAIKQLLAEYEVDETPPMMVKEPPITDEDMAVPGGRVPTYAQIEEWLDREDNDVSLTGGEALVYSLKIFEENKAKSKKK